VLPKDYLPYRIIRNQTITSLLGKEPYFLCADTFREAFSVKPKGRCRFVRELARLAFCEEIRGLPVLL